MYKVLIVDDEVYVAALIENLIDWQHFGMYICAKADNGIAALDIIIEEKPDITIVDVRMPGYDGITLMQKARELGSKSKFVVISGHKNFEYAQSAIKYGVEDYLLKPIKKNDLETILRELISKLDLEKATQSRLSTMSGKLIAQQQVLRSHFLNEASANKLDFSSSSLQDLNAAYGLHFENGVFILMLLKFDFSEKQVNNIFLDELLAKTALEFETRLGSSCREYLHKTIQPRVFFLLNADEKEIDVLYDIISKAFASLKLYLQNFKNIYATLSISDAALGIAAIPELLSEVRKIDKSRISLGVNKILDHKAFQKYSGSYDLKLILTEPRRLEFKKGVVSLNADAILISLQVFFREANLQNHVDPSILFLLCDRVFELFFESIKDLIPASVEISSLYSKLETMLDSCINGKELMNALFLFIKESIDEHIVNNFTSENPIIRISKKYIFEHYRDEISLATVSKVVNLNPVYFSYLFRNATGVNFTDYVNNIRIEKAKELLRDIRINISEVAFLTGFANARHLSRAFRRNVGINPSDYRNRHV
jgi:two-component system response regulator YesN